MKSVRQQPSRAPTAAPALPLHVEAAYCEAIAVHNRSREAIVLWKEVAHETVLQRRQIGLILEKLPEHGALLDIGTGSGIVPHAFHLLGYRVLSVDYPAAGGVEALERLNVLGVEGVYAEVGHDELPLAAGSFDVVFAGDVIEHLPDSPKSFLSELIRLLRPGGWLVLSTPNSTRLTVRVKVAMGFSNWPSIDDFYNESHHFGHHKEYTAKELEYVLRLSGLEAVDISFVEARVGTVQIASLSDISTQRRFGKDVRVVRGFKGVILRAGTAAALATITRIPMLASELLGSGQKPGEETRLRTGDS